MRQVLALLALVAVVFAPTAPAQATVPPTVAVETCAMPCCHDEAPAADCAPACPCPVSRIVPTQTTAVLPAAEGLRPPAAFSASPGRISDETASVRNVRPPVPPPRA